MYICTESWHYRWLKFCFMSVGLRTNWEWEEALPKSLCTYFWKWWLYTFFFLLMWGTIMFMLFCCTLGYPIILWAAFHNHVMRLIAPAIMIGVIWFCILIYWLLVDLSQRPEFWAKLFKKLDFPGRKKTMGFLQLCWCFCGSVHRKVCPLITYVEWEKVLSEFKKDPAQAVVTCDAIDKLDLVDSTFVPMVEQKTGESHDELPR